MFLFSLALGVFHYHANDEIVGHSANDRHGPICYTSSQPYAFDKEQHETSTHNKEVEHMCSNNTDKVEHRRLRLESPIDSKKIIEAQGDDIARDKSNQIGRKFQNDVIDRCVY